MKDVVHELQSKINEQNRQLQDSERHSAELKHRMNEAIQTSKQIEAEFHNVLFITWDINMFIQMNSFVVL